MYLLFSLSPYTQDQLMNYKSLDCYQNFANGWVREVYCMIFGENRLLIAKVREAMSPTVVYCRDIDRSSLLYGNLYVSFSRLIILRGCPKSLSLLGSSARSREKSCRPTVIAWLVLAKVVPMSRHFNLWAIVAGFKRRDSLTVTEKKAYWVLPSAVKSVPYSRVKDIQFSKTPTSKPSPAVKDKSVSAPLETELTNFLSSIKTYQDLKTCTVISYTWTLWLLCTQISGSWTTNCAVKFVWSAPGWYRLSLSPGESRGSSWESYGGQEPAGLGGGNWKQGTRPVQGSGFGWGLGGSQHQNPRLPVVLIQPALHSLSSWAFVIQKWPASTPRQPSGAVSMKGQQGRPAAAIRRTDIPTLL